MLKFNNKVLKILDKWLNPNGVSPIPPGPDPEEQPLTPTAELGNWSYNNFTQYDGTYDSSAYYYLYYIHTKDGQISTRSTNDSPMTCYAKISKTVAIPDELKNDDYLLLEIPMRSYRSSNYSTIINDGTYSNYAVTVRKTSSPGYIDLNNRDCKVVSRDGRGRWNSEISAYTPANWFHSLSSNYYTSSVSVTEDNDKTRKLRILYNLKNGDYYIMWGTNLNEEIYLRDFNYAGTVEGGLGNADYYTINIYADGLGWVNYDYYDGNVAYRDSYLFSGYVSNNTNCQIKLRSFKSGTI